MGDKIAEAASFALDDNGPRRAERLVHIEPYEELLN
jgi:hypothetical protein